MRIHCNNGKEGKTKSEIRTFLQSVLSTIYLNRGRPEKARSASVQPGQCQHSRASVGTAESASTEPGQHRHSAKRPSRPASQALQALKGAEKHSKNTSPPLKFSI